MEKTERFGLTLSPLEKMALRRLSKAERISAAAVVRRLVWNEASRLGLLPGGVLEPSSRGSRMVSGEVSGERP